MNPIGGYFKTIGQDDLSDMLKYEAPSVVKIEDDPVIEDFISVSGQFDDPSKLPRKRNKGIKK